MKFRKLLALILAAILCLSVLGGCISSDPDEDEITEEEEEEEEEEAEETTKEEEKDEKPDKDDKEPSNQIFWNKEDFTFLHIRQLAGTKDYYGGRYLDSDSYTGLTIEDAVYERNAKIEEKLNVNIVERIEDGEEPLSFLQTAAFADDYTFDVIYGWGHKLGACVIEGLLGDISSLPYVDLTRDYWAPDACEDLMINNRVYMVPSDISMNRLDWATFMSFNKRIVEDYNIVQGMGGKTFYELVNEGKWTIDKFLQAVQLISTDMDGNGTIDNTDVYGLIDASGTGEIYGLGCGIDLVKRNDDGSYLVSYYDENSSNLATKINEIFTNKKFVKSYMDLMYSGDIPDGMDQFEYARSFFSNGHSLFITGSAYTMNEFRDMEDEYGILPMPKFNESQENYISTVDSNAAMFAIPTKYRTDISFSSPDRTGKVLEAMSKLSSQTVLPAYIDTIVKHGPYTAEHDLAMLDIIYNTTHYEFAYMFQEHTESITYAYSSMFSSPTSSLSTFRAKSKVMQKALDDFYIDMLTVEDKLAG